MANHKIIGTYWFTGKDTVGAVAVEIYEPIHKEENRRNYAWVAYLGQANSRSMDIDKLYIASYGCTLDAAVARAIFPKFKRKRYKGEKD